MVEHSYLLKTKKKYTDDVTASMDDMVFRIIPYPIKYMRRVFTVDHNCSSQHKKMNILGDIRDLILGWNDLKF